MEHDQMKTRKIFLIGFNKCGTTSFHDFFKANDISSVHWRANTLAMAMEDNFLSGKKLLEGIDKWTAYTDILCIPGSPWYKSNSNHRGVIEGCRYFKKLHKDYSDALFILNTRDPMQWIKSRLKHDDGQFAIAYQRALASEGINSKQKLIMRWLQDWHEHHADVIKYFSKKSPDQCLLFHISKTPVKELTSFLESYFNINCDHFPHNHKSK